MEGKFQVNRTVVLSCVILSWGRAMVWSHGLCSGSGRKENVWKMTHIFSWTTSNQRFKWFVSRTWVSGTVLLGRIRRFAGSTRFDQLFSNVWTMKAYDYELSQLLLLIQMRDFVAKQNIHQLKIRIERKNNILTGLRGLIFFTDAVLALSSSSSVKSTKSWEIVVAAEDGGSGEVWELAVVAFLIIDVLFVTVIVVAVLVVVKHGINCCNEGPVVRIGVRKLLKGRGAIDVGPLRFGVECVPLTC